jgi:hypothetical protein
MKRNNFFQFFLLDKWITYFTSFLWTRSTSNSDYVWAHSEVLLKTCIKFIFLVFWGALICSHVAKIAQGLQGRVLRKKFFLPIESWFFTLFFHFSFCSWFCMMSPSMWPLWSECEVFDFFKKFYNVEILN